MGIYYNEKNCCFYLESKNLSYVFKINSFGFLQHIYFGKRIAKDDLDYYIYQVSRAHSAYLEDMEAENTFEVLSAECPVYGRGDFRESVLAFNFDGIRVCDLKYKNHLILDHKLPLEGMPSAEAGKTLVVTLDDPVHDVEVALSYSVYEDLPVILRHSQIFNRGNKEIGLDRAYSFSFDLPDARWQMLSLYGAHLRERHIQRENLHHGVVSIDSKYGVSSAQMNPFMAIVRPETSETVGEAYGCCLTYSGNFVFKAQVGQNDIARVMGGIQDYDFNWTLAPGECFTTPETVLVYSDGGLGQMSRAFHDFFREHLINQNYVNTPRPIVLNSWEAVYMDFDTEKLCQMIRSIRGTGIDTFVLDDGWFGDRYDDHRSLGDWFVNTKKLPDGLKPVIDCAHENGLKFGIWFEPEMVNRESVLFQNHPEWIIHAPQMVPCQGRFQYVLDLTRSDVRDYIVESVSSILSAYQIDYVKWDMNRSITENYSEHLGRRGKEFAHRYVLCLYDILDRIIYKFPKVIFEGCASGGARFDAAMLAYFPQIWTSDNTDALDRCAIQYGTSMCYPLSSMSCHVSACPNHQNGRLTDFGTRTAIASLGATGYELDPEKITAEDAQRIQKDIELYRQTEDLVLTGDLYRLHDPMHENLFAEQIVSKDKRKSVLIAMRPLCVSNGVAIRVRLQGLDEQMLYEIAELKIKKRGSTLMYAGLLLEFGMGDFKSQTLHINSVEE